MMSIEWPWNPNHKIKLHASIGSLEHRWLFRIWFSNKDQSIYFCPLGPPPFTIGLIGEAGLTTRTHQGDGDFHFSIHESGVLQMTDSAGRCRLRGVVDQANPVRHVATFQVNKIDEFPVATLDDTNSPKGGYIHVPIFGCPHAPLMLTILCSEVRSCWSPPGVGDAMVMHYKTRMKGKDHFFHFVTWQESSMPFGQGQFGWSCDAVCGSRFGL